MAKVLISPGKYVQGAGEMKKLGEYAQNYGKKALILISKGGYKRIGAMVEKSFEGKECGYVFETESMTLEKLKFYRDYLVKGLEKVCPWAIEDEENR